MLIYNKIRNKNLQKRGGEAVTKTESEQLLELVKQAFELARQLEAKSGHPGWGWVKHELEGVLRVLE